MMSPGVVVPRLSTLLRQDQAGDEHVPVLSDLLQRPGEQEAAGAATPDWLRNAGAVLAGGEEDPAEVTMDQTTFVGGGMIPEERPPTATTPRWSSPATTAACAAGAGGGSRVAAVVGRLGGGASRLAQRDERRW